MMINCGFVRRKTTKRGRKKGFEHRNIQGIEIKGLDIRYDSEQIRNELMCHRPEGKGWSITGYALIEE